MDRTRGIAVVVTLLLLGGAPGCGNECDRALEKLENECHFNEDAEGGVDECDGWTECFARCLNEASCEEIAHPQQDGPYLRCVWDCPQEDF